MANNFHLPISRKEAEEVKELLEAGLDYKEIAEKFDDRELTPDQLRSSMANYFPRKTRYTSAGTVHVAYMEGAEARKKGSAIVECPYLSLFEASWWKAGWNDMDISINALTPTK